MENTENNSKRRIAKNTITLYLRGLITLVIGLFTSRVIIDALGIEDYGVYGVAGGFVGLLSFLNASMTGATSRFITYEIGLGNFERVKSHFANALSVHICIAVIVALICEIIGVWFLNNKLNIPEQSIVAANWVFQLSVFTTCISITQVPYSAMIISHERMSVYAYMEIINVVLKLMIVYLLLVLPGNRLIIYSLLTAIVATGVMLSYRFYCIKSFKETRTGPRINKNIIKPMLSFSGWDLFGNACVTSRTQGTTFLLNIFYGVAINGAASIANVINGTISGFSNNIITAFRPQIIKNYARYNWQEFQNLIVVCSQSTIIMLMVMFVPLMFETDFVFRLWLGEIPEYVIIFSRILIFMFLFSQLWAVLGIGIHATGKIKILSFLSGSLFILTLPGIYFILKLDYPPYWAFITTVIFNILIWLSYLVVIKNNIKTFEVRVYLFKLLILLPISIPAIVICYTFHSTLEYGLFRFIIVCISSVLIYGVMSYIFILNKRQQGKINNYITNFFKSFMIRC